MESYELSLLPHPQPQYLIWSTLLHFATMSSDAPEAFSEIAALFYSEYKLTVYDNLFVGIVYGERLG